MPLTRAAANSDGPRRDAQRAPQHNAQVGTARTSPDRQEFAEAGSRALHQGAPAPRDSTGALEPPAPGSQTVTEDSFGAALRCLMQARGYSVRSLANQTFYSPSLVGHILTGKRRPNSGFVESADAILHARGVLVELAGLERVGKNEMYRRTLLARVTAIAGASVLSHKVPAGLTEAAASDSADLSVMETVRAILAADPEHRSHLVDVPPIEVLEDQVSTIRRLRVGCKYGDALRLLPGTVRALHAMLNGAAWRNALRLLILAEEAAASIIRYQGTVSAMTLVAERLKDSASLLGDPVLTALGAFQRAQAASAYGEDEYTIAVTNGALSNMASSGLKESGAVEIQGMLLMTASRAFRSVGNLNDSSACLQEAKRLAARTGDTMTLSLFFGPTNIHLWELNMAAYHGDSELVISLAHKIDPRQVPHIQRRVAYHVDAGRALADMRRDGEALRMLKSAERLAPTHVSADPIVVATAQSIADRHKNSALNTETTAFYRRLGVG